ncbi:hypothetical protein POSPLADRAFT_1063422 [Postia placenta MAD-698-R-SB12]|uniref:Uncharacterized protein n=1 Tax=Postia placenta MAD-698-R-SB12 TaxID=670580 RepID=A0A1X6MHL8_9APHY|nr:hypothetical protein POSPLADRAFT_1063422 [Postia placenta MAD-698-R-SB12]OSX55848.1 hypothetical protein POSPLADRAFT_1063422 [Postia placenta MAD-698-R-SB12]
MQLTVTVRPSCAYSSHTPPFFRVNLCPSESADTTCARESSSLTSVVLYALVLAGHDHAQPHASVRMPQRILLTPSVCAHFLPSARLNADASRAIARNEPRFCLQATGSTEDVAVSNMPCAMGHAMTLDSSRPRSTSTGAAAVDHKARQDSVDGGAREHTTGDAGARHAQEIARTRARGRAVSSAHRGQWRMRVRRTTSSRQHPTRVKETTTGTASVPPEERDSDAQGGDCRARRRPRAASVRPSILCTPSAASNAPAPDAQPDLRESSHTTRVGTPSVPLFPLASPAVRRPTTAPVRLHPPAAAAGASEQRPGHESSAVSGAVDRSHIARAAKLRLTHNATDRVQQRMISRTFALPALCVR